MKTDTVKSKILLEAGTNELEIVEFLIGKEYYGINVAKVREIIRANSGIVPVPDSHESVAGVVNLRGRVTPVVDLAKHLGVHQEFDPRLSRIIIAEFNKMHVGFWVSGVTRIHRISWKSVESPEGLVQSKAGYAVGVVKIDDRILFLLDFEKIASVINPESGIQKPENIHYEAQKVSFDRTQKKVLIAEDSPFIRQLLSQYITAAGYKVELFNNGLEAWQSFERTLSFPDFRKIEDHCHLLITDIEMPQMDGLHLIKKIRETAKLKGFPCVVFSSMISPELSIKCKAIGADDQITKPEIERLVRLVDSRVL